MRMKHKNRICKGKTLFTILDKYFFSFVDSGTGEGGGKEGVRRGRRRRWVGRGRTRKERGREERGDGGWVEEG